MSNKKSHEQQCRTKHLRLGRVSAIVEFKEQLPLPAAKESFWTFFLQSREELVEVWKQNPLQSIKINMLESNIYY